MFQPFVGQKLLLKVSHHNQWIIMVSLLVWSVLAILAISVYGSQDNNSPDQLGDSELRLPDGIRLEVHKPYELLVVIRIIPFDTVLESYELTLTVDDPEYVKIISMALARFDNQGLAAVQINEDGSEATLVCCPVTNSPDPGVPVDNVVVMLSGIAPGETEIEARLVGLPLVGGRIELREDTDVVIIGQAPPLPEPPPSSPQEGDQEEFAPTRPREARQLNVLFPGERNPKLINVEVVDGIVVFEGDVLLGPLASFNSSSAIGPQAIGVKPVAADLWDGGVVPFVIGSDVQGNAKNRVELAIAHWEQVTDIRFVPHSNEPDYLNFIIGNGCASYVGRLGGPQDVIVSALCSTGNVIHELGHALGLFHEQSRCDRDTFVSIAWSNIEAGREVNFDNECIAGQDLAAYDYQSIMHYKGTAFTANGQATIETIPSGIAIGQRKELSSGDQKAIELLYPEEQGHRKPGELTIEEAVDQNNNRVIEDKEIMNAITFWIQGTPVPQTDGKTIGDVKVQALIMLWISGAEF